MHPAQLTLPDTTPSTPAKVFTDANTKGSTNLSVGGWVFCTHTGKPIDAHSEKLGTNIGSTQAEQMAIKRAIDCLVDSESIQHALVYSDSETAIEQVESDVVAALDSFELSWIPREKNWVADTISDTCLNRHKS